MAISDEIINKVFAAAWENAVRRNPVILAKHQSQTVIVRARERISVLLAEGCSVTEARDCIVNDLMNPKSSLYQRSH